LSTYAKVCNEFVMPFCLCVTSFTFKQKRLQQKTTAKTTTKITMIMEEPLLGQLFMQHSFFCKVNYVYFLEDNGKLEKKKEGKKKRKNIEK
jgi:hypothetical protein